MEALVSAALASLATGLIIGLVMWKLEVLRHAAEDRRRVSSTYCLVRQLRRQLDEDLARNRDEDTRGSLYANNPDLARRMRFGSDSLRMMLKSLSTVSLEVVASVRQEAAREALTTIVAFEAEELAQKLRVWQEQMHC